MQFQYRKIVFLTGAGISAESGLSLFRGKNGLWNNRNPEEVATAEALLQRRSDVLDFYNGLRHDMAEAKPNAAHLAISRLQQGYSGEVYILTQNMDTLHEKAGSENVYHIHGQINKIRCSHCIISGKHGMISRRICPALFAAPRNRCGRTLSSLAKK